MASWFKQSKRTPRSGETPGGDQAESTIEVKAQVIADAVRDGAATDAAGPAAHRGGGLGVDGVITGADFDPDARTDAVGDRAAGPDSSGGVPVDQALAERRILVQLCLYALDRARSSGVAERIEEGLAAVGVIALRPDGQHFDPAYHEAGGTVTTEDEGLDGVVAETEVVGFSDRGQLLRPPIVTVYHRPAR